MNVRAVIFMIPKKEMLTIISLKEPLLKIYLMTGSALSVRQKKNISLRLIELHRLDLGGDGRLFTGCRSTALLEYRALPTLVGFFLCCLLLLPSPSRGLSKHIIHSQDQSVAKELIAQSDAVFSGFLQDPNVKWLSKYMTQAHGVFIVPQMLRGAFLIGKSGGTGVLLARNPVSGKWSYPGFYTIDSVSTGLQIGADASEILLLVMTEQGMEAMLSSEYTIDSEIAPHLVVAAGPSGDRKTPISADMLAYGRSMMGIISGVSLSGAVITSQRRLNTAFYGRTVSLEDILLRQVVSNYKAEPLRSRVIKAGELTFQ
jgi:lipid-binding SYLF domain-containing protein